MPKYTATQLNQAAAKGDFVSICQILSDPSVCRDATTLEQMLDGFGEFLYQQGLFIQSISGKKQGIELFEKSHSCLEQAKEQPVWNEVTGCSFTTLSAAAAQESAYLVPPYLAIDSHHGSRLSQMFFAAQDLSGDAVKEQSRRIDELSFVIREGNLASVCYMLHHKEAIFTPDYVDMLLRAFAKGAHQFGLEHTCLLLPNMMTAINCFENIQNKTPSDIVFLATIITSIEVGSIEFPGDSTKQAMTKLQKTFDYCHPLIVNCADANQHPDAHAARLELEKQMALFEMEHYKYSLFAAVGQQTEWVPEKLYNWVKEYSADHPCDDLGNLPNSAIIVALSEYLHATIVINKDNEAIPFIVNRSQPRETIHLNLFSHLGITGRYQLRVCPKRDRELQSHLQASESSEVESSQIILAKPSISSLKQPEDLVTSVAQKKQSGIFYTVGFSGRLSKIIPVIMNPSLDRSEESKDQLIAGLSAFFYQKGTELIKKRMMQEANKEFRNVLAASRYVSQKYMVADLVERVDKHLKSASNIQMPLSFFSMIKTSFESITEKEPQLLSICMVLSIPGFILNPAICDYYLRQRVTHLLLFSEKDEDNLHEAADCLRLIDKKTLGDNLSLMTCCNQLVVFLLERKEALTAKKVCELSIRIGSLLPPEEQELTLQKHKTKAADLLLETSRLLKLIKTRFDSGNRDVSLFSSSTVAKNLSQLSAAAGQDFSEQEMSLL